MTRRASITCLPSFTCLSFQNILVASFAYRHWLKPVDLTPAGKVRSGRFRGDLGTDDLNQPHPLQTGVPVLADDDVVVRGDAERACDVDARPGHPNISACL